MASNGDGEFIFPLINGDLNQPGLKATEMSRRKVKRDRKQREKEKEEEEKRQLEEKQKADKEEQQEHRDIQMKEEDFWTDNSIQHLLSGITRNHVLKSMFRMNGIALCHSKG